MWYFRLLKICYISDKMETPKLADSSHYHIKKFVIITLPLIAISIMAQYEIEDCEEMLLVNKTVALTKPRAKVFQYMSDMYNVKDVRI